MIEIELRDGRVFQIDVDYETAVDHWSRALDEKNKHLIVIEPGVLTIKASEIVRMEKLGAEFKDCKLVKTVSKEN